MSQREKMRELFLKNSRNEDRTVAAYAAAERVSQVHRESTEYALTPEDYARRLLADGLRKGWLR